MITTKLTDEQRTEILRLHAEGHGCLRLSRMFGVCRSTIRRLASDTGRRAKPVHKHRWRASLRLRNADPADRTRLLELYAVARQNGNLDEQEWWALGLRVFGKQFREGDWC